MNHNRNSFVSGSYVALARAREPGNECVSTILSARFRGGCLRNTIVDRKRAGTHPHHSRPRPAGPWRQRGAPSSERACAAWYSTLNSPAIHLISNRAVRMSWVDRPVSGSTFIENAVLVDVWKGAETGRTFGDERGVVMPRIVQFFCPNRVLNPVQKP